LGGTYSGWPLTTVEPAVTIVELSLTTVELAVTVADEIEAQLGAWRGEKE
jgi:hypothetical protein